MGQELHLDCTWMDLFRLIFQSAVLHHKSGDIGLGREFHQALTLSELITMSFACRVNMMVA